MPQNRTQPDRMNEGQPLLEREVNSSAIALLRAWREEGDEQEQRETLEELAALLGDDRPPHPRS